MRTLTRKLSTRITRRRLRWFLICNGQSWVIQGALVGALTVIGVGAFTALVTAKITAYVVFAGQCYRAGRG